MKVGDLVMFELGIEYRRIGIIVKVGADDYKRKRLKINSDHPDTLHMIMLATGAMMWAQEKRLRIINESW